MIELIILIIISILVGYFIGKYFAERKKFGEKEKILKAQWEKKIVEIEKEYEIKLEKGNSLLRELREENNTRLEKLSREWQIKYIQDIEELKKLFKESEKIIKAKSVSSSRRSLVGKFIEKFIPFLKKLPYEPSDMHFLGQPVDYIVFQGLHKDEVDEIVFVEVKTGQSKLTKREKSLKKTIEKKNVSWKEIDINTNDNNFPYKEITNEDTSIDNIYELIEKKVSSVKDKSINFKDNKIEKEINKNLK